LNIDGCIEDLFRSANRLRIPTNDLLRRKDTVSIHRGLLFANFSNAHTSASSDGRCSLEVAEFTEGIAGRFGERRCGVDAVARANDLHGPGRVRRVAATSCENPCWFL
jgi:hypothetical protein